MSLFKAINRRDVFGAIVGAAVAVSLAAAPALAATKLRLSHLSPPDSDMDVWAKKFAQQVEEQNRGAHHGTHLPRQSAR